MKLHSVPDSGVYTIRSLHMGRRNADLLASMGLVPGATIEVGHNDFCGTLAVRCNKEWIILGRSETFNIMVVPAKKTARR